MDGSAAVEAADHIVTMELYHIEQLVDRVVVEREPLLKRIIKAALLTLLILMGLQTLVVEVGVHLKVRVIQDLILVPAVLVL